MNIEQIMQLADDYSDVRVLNGSEGSRTKKARAALEAALLEALAPQEPVAWRCKDYGDDWILFPDKNAAVRYQKNTGCLMQPLYAANGEQTP